MCHLPEIQVPLIFEFRARYRYLNAEPLKARSFLENNVDRWIECCVHLSEELLVAMCEQEFLLPHPAKRKGKRHGNVN
jgi:hypothetical protein